MGLPVFRTGATVRHKRWGEPRVRLAPRRELPGSSSYRLAALRMACARDASGALGAR